MKINKNTRKNRNYSGSSKKKKFNRNRLDQVNELWCLVKFTLYNF